MKMAKTVIINAAIEEIVNFIEEPFRATKRNKWLDNIPYIKLYVRKSERPHIIKNSFMLDIASIELSERIRGRKIFTEILDRLEKMNIPIYIENVLQHDLRSFLDRRGYTREHDDGYTTCHYKLPR